MGAGPPSPLRGSHEAAEADKPTTTTPNLPPAAQVGAGAGEGSDSKAPPKELDGVVDQSPCPSRPPGAPEIGTLEVSTVGDVSTPQKPSKPKPPFSVFGVLTEEGKASLSVTSRQWTVVAVPIGEGAEYGDLDHLLQFFRDLLEGAQQKS